MGELKSEWIIELSASDIASRARAAASVYAAGKERVSEAVDRWWRNAEFAQLFGGKPQLTVGLAVMPETFAKIREANGWPTLAEVPEGQDASEFELHFEPAIALDILTSREPDGAGIIAKFLSKQGEGVQQVEFLCKNVDRATAILREQFGVQPVYPETRPGANSTRINFFLVATSLGKKVLIEFYELPPAGSARSS
jgi:methylmalonyl-CoA/ethylmalonyl-CoA epimerase